MKWTRLYPNTYTFQLFKWILFDWRIYFLDFYYYLLFFCGTSCQPTFTCACLICWKQSFFLNQNFILHFIGFRLVFHFVQNGLYIWNDVTLLWLLFFYFFTCKKMTHTNQCSFLLEYKFLINIDVVPVRSTRSEQLFVVFWTKETFQRVLSFGLEKEKFCFALLTAFIKVLNIFCIFIDKSAPIFF